MVYAVRAGRLADREAAGVDPVQPGAGGLRQPHELADRTVGAPSRDTRRAVGSGEDADDHATLVDRPCGKGDRARWRGERDERTVRIPAHRANVGDARVRIADYHTGVV